MNINFVTAVQVNSSMFKRFSENFHPGNSRITEEGNFFSGLPGELFELMNSFSGMSFNKGVYRVHSFTSSMKWAQLVNGFFPGYANKMVPFGFDWAGRQYCINVSENRMIYMFDPANREDYKLETDLVTFHNEDLVNDYEAMLSPDIFTAICELNGLDAILWNECLAYKIPLFLGGKDVISNYEKTDNEVYWVVNSQLYTHAMELPDGTPVNSVYLARNFTDNVKGEDLTTPGAEQ